MSKFIKKILWPTDFSPESLEALRYAAFLAERFSSRIIALHVVSDFAPALYDTSLVIRKELQGRVSAVKRKAQAKLRATARRRGVSFQRILVREGAASKKIIETAEKERVDLIVMGKRGQSLLEKIFIGSVANHVLRHASVPVLITKKSRRKLQVKKILVPTDFIKKEETERELAWKLAKEFGASMTLLYVMELYGHDIRRVDDLFEAVLKNFRQRVKKSRKAIQISEDVTRAINASIGVVDYARTHRYDLIVMATCASRLGRFFLGSTTEKVISYTDLPVFAIPPEYC